MLSKLRPLDLLAATCVDYHWIGCRSGSAEVHRRSFKVQFSTPYLDIPGGLGTFIGMMAELV